ncbi:MAG: hypothetical protein A2V98_15410 [Planctomycetes bacterium RBG_16_64_12]|nr:MAG: hypothetical protein A2V98_15410 [Planctomycetes bacterium RBG_16_64_12]
MPWWAALAGPIFLISGAQGEVGPVILRDVTEETGITFRHTDGGSGRHYIVEYVASGLATFDYDGDGLIDVYFLNGAPLMGTQADTPPRNALYRNLGDWRFADVTDTAGVGDTGHGLGVTVGDYDNDGDQDLYVNNFGPNVLYRNNGNGTFTDVTQHAKVACGDNAGAGANFLDIEADGDLDLFVAHYIRFNYQNHVTSILHGAPWYAGPLDFSPQPNQLFRNNGDGTFADVSRESGIAAHAGAGMGTVCADYDNDGDTDIFVGNDLRLDFLFQNDGSGKFEEVALASGVACNYAGIPVGSMGVDCSDFNNDGWLDFFLTDFEMQKPILFQGLGGGIFEDATMQTGVGVASEPYVKWGCGFVDFDNDGHRDVFYGRGDLGERLNLAANRTTYLVSPILFRNTGQGKFVNVSTQSGDGMKVKVVARGIAFDDLDNDGRVDVVILSSRHPAVVLRNQSQTGNHWLEIRLRGVRSNRDGVGAQLKVIAGDLTQIAEVHSGRSYQSHFGSRLHFGLGKRSRVDRIEIRWIAGGTDVVENVAADQLVEITEGGSTR